MKRFRNLLLASAGIIFFALSLTLATGGRTAIAQITRECIRICDEIPIRVSLTNVARIVGDVKITNDGDSPIPTRVNNAIQVESSTRNALRTKPVLEVTDTFQREVTITLEPGDSTEKVSFQVPQSRLLVIEGVSGIAQMGPVFQLPQVLFKTTANGDPGVHYLFTSLYPGNGVYSIYQPSPVPGYADPASTVEVTFSRIPNSTGTAKLSLTFTGHFIDQ